MQTAILVIAGANLAFDGVLIVFVVRAMAKVSGIFGGKR
jgi:hypothetical protein